MVKNTLANAGDPGLTPALEDPLEKGILQYPCLENSMDRGTWWAIVHEVTKTWTQLRD